MEPPTKWNGFLHAQYFGAYPDTGGSYRTYTNSVFVNRTILVPTYRPEVDTPALAQYQELLLCQATMWWASMWTILGEHHRPIGGYPLHHQCHWGRGDPLWIVHQPIAEANVNSTVTVDAMIKHNSGISTASVFWREAGTTTYTEVPMGFVSDDNWTADLTMPSVAGEVEYYIAAEANSGQDHGPPIVAPEGYWTIQVGSLSIEDWAEQQLQGLSQSDPWSGAFQFEPNTRDLSGAHPQPLGATVV